MLGLETIVEGGRREPNIITAIFYKKNIEKLMLPKIRFIHRNRTIPFNIYIQHSTITNLAIYRQYTKI